jgi:coatomer subunit delta
MNKYCDSCIDGVNRALPSRGKGMQLGKKSKTTNMFEQVKGELGPEADVTSPLVPTTPAAAPAAPASGRPSTATDREAIHITTSESISAKLDREGVVKSFEVKGDLQLKISDAALTQIKLDLAMGDSRGASFNTHPKVDKKAFRDSKAIQLADTSKGFPSNMGIEVMRWKVTPKADSIDDPPITFRVWVEDSGSKYNINVEYEWTGGDPLKDVTVTIPFATSEPIVSSFDAVYEVSGDILQWNIGVVDDNNASGSFEFEAATDNADEFFPMQVRFAKSRPFVDVEVSRSLKPLSKILTKVKCFRSLA